MAGSAAMDNAKDRDALRRLGIIELDEEQARSVRSSIGRVLGIETRGEAPSVEAILAAIRGKATICPWNEMNLGDPAVRLETALRYLGFPEPGNLLVWQDGMKELAKTSRQDLGKGFDQIWNPGVTDFLIAPEDLRRFVLIDDHGWLFSLSL